MKKVLLGLLAFASIQAFANTKVVLYTGDYIGSFTNRTSLPKDYSSKLKAQLEQSGYSVVETISTVNSNLFPFAMDRNLDELARKHDAKVVSFFATVPYIANNKGNVKEAACAMSLEIRTPAPLVTEDERSEANANGVIIIPQSKILFKTALGTEFHKPIIFKKICDSTFNAIIDSLRNH
jgi:hypothetical protein